MTFASSSVRSARACISTHHAFQLVTVPSHFSLRSLPLSVNVAGGLGKLFVGQLVEEGRRVMAESGEAPDKGLRYERRSITRGAL